RRAGFRSARRQSHACRTADRRRRRAIGPKLRRNARRRTEAGDCARVLSGTVARRTGRASARAVGNGQIVGPARIGTAEALSRGRRFFPLTTWIFPDPIAVNAWTGSPRNSRWARWLRARVRDWRVRRGPRLP